MRANYNTENTQANQEDDDQEEGYELSDTI